MFPIASGLCDAASRGVIKATSVHRLTLVAAGFFCALPTYVIWLTIEGVPTVQPVFWILIAAHVPLLALANVLTVEAHRASPLTLTVPYLSLTPAMLLVTSPLMGGGRPTVAGGVGVLVIAVGIYILNLKSERRNLWEPFRLVWRELGSRLMLIVAMIFALTANLDYLALRSANAPFYLVVDHGASGAVTAFVILWYLGRKSVTARQVSPIGSWRILWLYGTVIAVSVVTHMLAFQWIPSVPYVIAAKRSGAILFTVSLGIYMSVAIGRPGFERERESLRYRLPGVGLMIIGMIVVILWGKE